MKELSRTRRLLLDSLKKNWAYLAGLFGLIVMGATLSSVTPMIFQKVIDDLAVLKLSALVLYVLAVVMIPFIITLLDVGKTKLSFMLTNNVGKQLRTELYEHLLNVKMREFSKNSIQGFHYSITRYVGKICDVFLGGDVLSLLANIVQIATAFLFLLMLNWTVALGCIVVIPMLYLLIRSQRRKVDKKESELNDTLREGESIVAETLKNMKVVRMFNGKGYEKERFARWQERNITAGWGVRFTHALAVNILPHSVEQLMYGVVFVFCIALVKQSTMTTGTLVAVLSYVPLFYRSMIGLLSVQIGLSAVAKPIRGLDEIFAMEREEGTEPLPIEEAQFHSDAALLRFSDVFFTYGQVPCNVKIPELTIKKGEFIAIVGESGGGKTTIFDLICKFFDPLAGNIYFMGRDIRPIKPDALRRYIALMPQESLLWDENIAANIAYPEKKLDGEKLDRMIRSTALTQLYKRLAASEDNTIGEYGNRISGGEKQRLSVARAMNKEALLYLFDEPTSLMDSITAEQVFKSIQAISDEKKTVLMVTHNLAHTKNVDRILVFKDGKIVGFDSYENLMSSCAYFSLLVRSDSSAAEQPEN